MNFLFGAIIFAIGLVILRFRYHIRSFTGEWSWAMRYLGSNGTITAIVLIGMLLLAVGTAFPLGAFDRDDDTPQSNQIHVAE